MSPVINALSYQHFPIYAIMVLFLGVTVRPGTFWPC